MEVKPGYKRTEAGVIPEDWETIAAADIVEQSAPICYGVVQVGRNVDSGVPIVAIKWVKEIGWAPLHCTSTSLERPYARSRVKAGDVLISIKGTIGRVGVVPDGFEGNISRELARLRLHQDLSGEYIAHQLEAGITQARIAKEVVGTTRLEFSIAMLRQFELPIPPSLSEQRAIATALSDVDALLASLERLIAKKRDLKQATMQQLLTGQTRLPGFHREWQVMSLDTITSRATGVWGKNKSDERNCRRVEIIRAGDVSQDGKLTGSATRFISPSDYEKAKCDLDDLVITTSGNGLGKLWWCDGRNDIAASNFVRVIRPKTERVLGKFLYYALRSGEGIRQLQEHTATSAYPNLRPTYFSTAWIPLPTLPEQTAIAAVLSDMDAEFSALEARRDKTRDLKQAMTQELLTGRIRLV